MAPIRTMRPVYVDRLPPCNHACPAGENVQAWLSEAQAGRYREAWTIIVRDNPMPAVHGRVCYHPCEDACNRKDVDAAVSIHAVERFLGDMALREGWTVAPDEPPSVHRVLVVGAGPSGLSAAWHLARRGHKVVVHEAGPMAGGMMHFGIPKYRLPREVLDGEIERIRRFGVEIVLNHKVTDLVAQKTKGGSMRSFSPSAPTSASARKSPRARRREGLRRAAVPEGSRNSRPDAADWPAGGDLRWRRYGDGRGSDCREARRGAAHHLPPHARADARR